ncbi:SigE family RNA polymerase sigma factor [Actinoplanes aureus]|uniref:SigE family RNA polymerase sigma factor n=1 Tax=Actinoplanes aureus TaxID=2792083 RepID=A0A931G267_9ACTN|nr:SigE family RNA polymerase sigma factor [Actinoplanes aureus]MBG0565861.1 SigE family RNA polymerase sigma factor [Actinoplanes aureus]
MEQEPGDFAAFYQAAGDHCLRAVLVVVGDRHLAEDLVAEAFARAWSSWSKVAQHPAPVAWVVRTALNTRISWWRRRRREVHTADVPERDRPDQAVTSETVPDARLMAALKALPKRQREVVALRVLLDLDAETTARTLGIATGTVGAHLSRATRALRIHLGTATEQEPLR